MSSDKLYRRIESSGVEGIRRMKLSREFGTKTGKIIEDLLSQGLIFAEKKGGATTYWSKDNYLQHLMGSDPKFKLIYDMYSNTNTKISSKISRISNDIDKKVSTITSDLSKKVASDLNKKVASMVAEVKSSPARTDDNGNDNNNGNHLTLDQFRMEIDRVIAAIPTSIGWVELAAIRERVCSKYSISKENFYVLASQLFEQFNNNYELSSGGNEGVIVRGLVHGFVRCI